MSLKKLLLSFCPLLLFGKLEFCHTFSLIQQHKNYRKCMEDVKFSKKRQRPAVHSTFSVQFL